MKKIGIFMADGCEEIEGLTVVDVVRRAGIAIDMISITGKKEVAGAHGITFAADVLAEEADFDSYDGIVLPGGESTVQGKLMKELGMFDIIKSQIKNGMPVLATCAGMILLADKLEAESKVHLQTIPMTVKRNAYGRQLGSFHTEAVVEGIGEVPMTFIRAPYIAEAGEDVKILAEVDGKIVAVRQGRQLVTAFHPELDGDTRIHEYFLNM